MVSTFLSFIFQENWNFELIYQLTYLTNSRCWSIYGIYFFHVSNCCCLLNWIIQPSNHWLIDWTNLLRLLSLFYNFSIIIFKWFKSILIFKGYLFGSFFSIYWISRYFPLGFYFWSWCHWFLTCLFTLIVSEFIDPESCTQVWLKIFCGSYPNQA